MTQREAILQYIKAFIAAQGYSPSVREIVAATGMSTTSLVAHHLGVLGREGFISMEPRKSRTIRVLKRTAKQHKNEVNHGSDE
jgi:repressor LexA